MNKKIVDYYYNKILFYSKNNNYYDTVKSNEKNIIDSLNIIVDNNLDYLLTDSFLCYICSENMVSLRLFRMYFNKYELIGLLSSYIKSICNEYKNNDSDDSGSQENNGEDARNVYQKPIRTKEQTNR